MRRSRASSRASSLRRTGLRSLSSRLTADSLKGPLTLRASFVDTSAETADAFSETSKVLGRGSFGVVSLVRDKRTGEPRAMKTSKRRATWDQDRFEMEARLLQNLDHPHILRIFSWFEEGDSISILMEVSDGGELLQLVQAARLQSYQVPEAWAMTGFCQAFEALVYIHAKGVVHKDLKGENLLLLKRTEGPQGEPFFRAPHVVICDLGLAEVCHEVMGKFRACQPAGTPSFMAPEVWKGNFGPASDIWSMGCIIFELFSGSPAFRIRSGDAGTARADVTLQRGPNWALFQGSSQAQSLCRKLLSFPERKRPTAEKCLADVCLKQRMASITKEEIFHLCQVVKQWPSRSRSQRALCLILAASCTSLKPIAAMFARFDKDHSGTLDMAEIVAALTANGVDAATAADTARAVDVNRDGVCEFLEFAAAALPSQEADFQAMLRQQFRYLDVDNRGLLAPAEVASFLEELGQLAANHGLTPQDLDLDGDGSVSFNDFCEYFGAGRISSETQVLTCSAVESCSAEMDGQLSTESVKDTILHPLSIFPTPRMPRSDPNEVQGPSSCELDGRSAAVVQQKGPALGPLISSIGFQGGCTDWTQMSFLFGISKLFARDKTQKVLDKAHISL